MYSTMGKSETTFWMIAWIVAYILVYLNYKRKGKSFITEKERWDYVRKYSNGRFRSDRERAEIYKDDVRFRRLNKGMMIFFTSIYVLMTSLIIWKLCLEKGWI